SAGKYSGAAGAISIVSGSLTLGNLLGHSSDTRYAYFDESGTTPFTGVLGNKSLTGTVTVKKCNHTGEGVCEYTHATSTTTHQQTCLACGKKWDEENCSYADSRCACGSTLSVALAGTERLIYDGNPREPGVTVTLDGTKLAETDYGVTYANNINAGTDTATVTVKGKENYSFEIKKTFSIEKAEQKDFAATAVTTQYEKNGTFILSTTGGSGDGAVLYRVPENNGVLMVNGDQATIIGVGTVAVTATKAESDNYKAATATGKITIEKAPAPAITYPTAGSITYGQKLSDSALTGGSTEYGTFAWENGSMVPAVDNTGYTVVFTASGETKKNYETITDTTQKVSVKVEKAVPAVSITAAVSGSKDDRQSAITVNVAEAGAGAGAFPTGTVTFIDCTGSTEVEIGAATLSNGTASYTWDGLLDKTYTIKAVYAGDSNYKEAVSREFTFDAAKQNQQDFALDAIGAKTYGDAAITLKTTGGNGSGAVRYESSDEDVIRIEDGRAVIVGAGTATITAIKEGDDKYNEASASRNVTVAKKALTVRADSKTVVRGNPMPALTYRADGLVNGDTFTKAPSITAGVQNTDTLGKYDIVINGGTLQNSESYHITYVNGTLKIVERFYTVTVTDGTGGGEYAEGDTVTVTANDRSGYTFTGWSSEDGVGFADSKAKTTTFTMPAKSVTVKANYTRNSSGGNNGGGSGDGGNSGGSGNSGGGNSGDNGNNGGGGSTNPGNGNTTPQIPVIPPAENTNPGTGTTPVNPGNGNTSRPGSGSGSGTGTPAQGTKQPFIKGEDGKTGWDVIRAEEEQAQEGSTINVDMNGSVVVPGDIFDSIKGKDITITFDMGNGIIWSVDGKSITADKAGDIDFSVKTGVKAVPVDIVNNVTGESYSIQLSLAYEGDFGFTAVLSIGLGKENAGYTASLYYYNESTGELEFICSDEVAQDGTVSLAFTHASDYVIAIDGKQEGGDGAAESAQPDGKDGTAGNGTAMEKPSQEGQQWRLWWLIVAGVLVLAMGAGVFFIRKKKSDED
ncbi:MAG: MBG domain-containing protein, partial [Lachnospiraceae bacterium]|nr:MBG domain-containing protein [Lachnospiraceae bacterium]